MKNTIYGIMIAALLLGAAFTIPQQAYAEEPTYLDFTDFISDKVPVTNDEQLFGIACGNDGNNYVTLFKNGGIIQYNRTVTVNENGTITRDKSFFQIPDADTGEGFWDIKQLPNGKLIVNQKDRALVWVFNSTGTTEAEKWKPIPTIPKLDLTKVSYFTGTGGVYNDLDSSYKRYPWNIKSDLTANTNYNSGFNSFGGIEISSVLGKAIIGQNYKWNFIDDDNTAGLNDITFNGLVKLDYTTLDPSDNIYINMTANNVTDIRGLHIDKNNNNHIWITSQQDNKLIKFDLSKNDATGILASVTFPNGTEPTELSDDDDFLYIGTVKTVNGNNSILKVNKTDITSYELIDTGATNNQTGTGSGREKGGVFSTFTVPDKQLVFWSDQSKHIGYLDLGNNTKTVIQTSKPNSNHFACSADGKMWFSGEGSPISGSISFFPSVTSAVNENNGGSDSEHLTKPTFGLSHINPSIQRVTDGFMHNGKAQTINDNFHTDFELQVAETGKPNEFVIKSFNPKKLLVHEIWFGCPHTGADLAKCEAGIETWYDWDNGNLTITDVRLLQDREFIDEESLLVQSEKQSCTDEEPPLCDATKYTVTFREPLLDTILAVKAIDRAPRYQLTWLNEGVEVSGESLNTAPQMDIMAPYLSGQKGLIKVTEVDRRNNMWVDDTGILYQQNDFGTFKRITPITVNKLPDGEWKVMERIHSDFTEYKKLEAAKAKYYVFDGDKLLNEVKPSKAYIYPTDTHRDRFIEEMTERGLLQIKVD